MQLLAKHITLTGGGYVLFLEMLSLTAFLKVPKKLSTAVGLCLAVEGNPFRMIKPDKYCNKVK